MKRATNDTKLVSDLLFDNLKRNQSDFSQRKSSNIQFKVVYKNAPEYNFYNYGNKNQSSCYPLPVKHSKKLSQKRQFQSQEKYNLNNHEMQNSAVKKVSVQFECAHRKRDNNIKVSPKRQSSTQLLQKAEISTLLTCSMKKYMGKIDRIKQRKISKFKIVQNFGLNVQSIKQQKSSIQLKPAQSTKFKSNRLTVFASMPVSKPKCKTEKSESISQSLHRKQPKKPSFYEYMAKQQDKSILARQKRLRNFLSIVLYSYGCFQKRNLDTQRKQQKTFKQKKLSYLYFVGPGNNRNMIISLMKKRWWWIQTDEINKANFVWTQLRQNNIVEKHSKLIYEQRVINQELLTLPEDLIQTKNAAINISALRLFHKKFNPRFYSKLPQQQQAKKLYEIPIPQILHNHYSCNVMVGNKKALFHNLSEYCKYYNQQLSNFFPLTFQVDNISGQQWQQFEKYALANKNTIWIVKPGENSNRGQNIFISDSHTHIKSKIKQMEKEHTFIIQKYVKNVLLYHRRKFDIRTYLLMVTIGGQSKFYWYHEGYIRTSSEIFSIQDLYDISIHLTNDAIQCENENYGKYEIGNKLSYHQFQRYLNTNYSSQFSIKKLNQRMKQIALKVVRATYNKIDSDKRDFGFELFGMDFLVTEDFNPLLLQVNTNPCLQLAATCLQRLIPWMVQNIFRLTIDPLFPPCCQCPRSLACYIPDQIMQRNRFQLIFDSIFDKDREWQRYCSGLDEQKYDDEQQQFENEGEIIALRNY